MEKLDTLPQSPALTKTKRGYLSLEDSDWLKAAEYFDEALDADPEYAPAYVGLLCAELKVTGETELKNRQTRFEDNPNFKKALRFADADYKARLETYVAKDGGTVAEAANTDGFRVGATVGFGGYKWRVLDIRDGKALLITEDITEQRAYHGTGTVITWEACDLRKYLNGEFYEKFGSNDKAKIVKTTNKNLNNQWYGTSGGNDTEDYVFLLSLDEAARYFGDSSELLRDKGDRIDNYISDGNNARRIASIDGEEHWWWLRSPGNHNDDDASAFSNTAASVFADGTINVDGNTVNSKYDGVRPALWFSLG